jgi:hypothetical protein
VDDDWQIQDWHFGGRYYGVRLASAPDSMDLELDHLGPAPEQGTVMIVSRDDNSGDMTVRVFTDQPLPLVLVEQFVSEARRRLPPNA